MNDIFNDIVSICKKGKTTIVTTKDNKYVLKEKNSKVEEIYSYLNSRGFDYYPKIIIPNEKYNIYEYINEYEYNNEEKMLMFVNILSILHTKTTYYKDMDIDEYKLLYESILNNINNTKMYYDNLVNSIELKLFMSPSEYLLIRNISKIYESLDYSISTLNNWYDLVKTNAKKRVVLLYNNIDINHLIKNKDIYLINFEKSIIDLPIYDLYNLYIKYATIYDFNMLFNKYEEIYPLNIDEKNLLFVLISIPNIVFLNNNEITNTKNIKKLIDLIYKREVFIKENDKIPE